MQPLFRHVVLLLVIMCFPYFFFCSKSSPITCDFPCIPSRAGLVFDIGMNTAQDTEKYLRDGWEVVAVEANPVLAARVSKRLHKEIAMGNLRVVVAGIYPGAAFAAKMPFYQHAHDTWSSFEKRWGCRDWDQSRVNMSLCEVVQVNTTSCFELFLRFGVPHYIKIDIESYDWQCLQDLDKLKYFNVFPEFVSSEDYNNDTIHFLGNLGYNRFKIVEQTPYGGASGPFGHEATDIYSGKRWRSIAEVLDPAFPYRPRTIGWRNLHAWKA